MDSNFSFLTTAQADLLNEILARRKLALLERVRQGDTVSRSDAEEVMSVTRNRLITGRLSTRYSRSSTPLASTNGPAREEKSYG